MNKKFRLAASAIIGFFMVFTYVGYALAAEEAMAQGESCPVDYSMSRPAQFSGYIGALALDRDKHELGRVVNVSEGTDGAIHFLVIYSCLGDMKDKLVAFPVKLSNTEQRIETVIINTTQEEFRGAPAIESRMWPNEVGTGWATKFYDYFENTLAP